MPAVIFILGTCVGSFLNVVIDRLPNGESIIHGRSHCDKCKKTLRWYDLFPILSFITLAGRCRYCRVKLSVQYPLVEFITGICFLLIYLYSAHSDFNIGSLIKSVYPYIFISAMIAVFVTDFKYRIIPDQVLIFLGVVTSLYLVLYDRSNLLSSLEAGVISFLLFLFLVLVTRGGGMGLGDVKYALLMGLILGFPKIIIGLYLAFLTGGVISLILILTGMKKMKSTIPFGPFLVGATIISFFWGDKIWLSAMKMMGI